MIKLLFYILFSFLTLNANVLCLDDTIQKINTINYQITVEDKEHNLSSENILKGEFQNFSTKATIGYSHSFFWTKTTIKNNSLKTTQYIFRNLRAGVDKIDVFIYDENKLLKTEYLGDKRGQKDREILSAKSAFLFHIQPNQQLTIITKYSSLGSLDLFWEILQLDRYSYMNGIDNILFGLFGGFIFLLILYNLMLFFTLKEKLFLFYTLQIFFIWWFIYAISGLFYFLDLELNLDFLTATTWLAPILMMFFSMLFIIEFFKLYQRNKTLYYLLLLFSALAVVFFLLFFYGYFFDETIFIDYSFIYLNISFLSYIFIFITSIWGMYKKIDGAVYIAIGEIIYLLSVIFITVMLKGETIFTNYSYFIMPIAVILQMLFYSFALSKKIKKMKNDFENTKLLLIQNQHYIEYGKMAGNISHQWKQPLSNLSSQIMYLSMLKTLNQEDKIKDEFLAMVPQLNYTIELMANTITLFNNTYQHSFDTTTINIKNTIEQLIHLYNYKIVLNNISVQVESLDNTLEIATHKDSFLQIFIILLDNSIDQFEKLKHQNSEINIQIIPRDDFVEIVFQDNAGGIKLPLTEIFKPHITSKEGKSGIGLHILETILHEKLYGQIEVKSIENRAIFTIFIPKIIKK
ncbi:MAG: sensor histidine kinase [Arcobacteraceae bacterium]|nr:sensor histidine kinase [Arcobacteraceae bacterium]